MYTHIYIYIFIFCYNRYACMLGWVKKSNIFFSIRTLKNFLIDTYKKGSPSMNS